MNQYPKVSVISVNYNQAEVTCDMLESLLAVDWPNLEVIVVDNASPGGAAPITERFPQIKFISSAENLGFAGGNNLAIKEATGDYILLLNNDTIVPKDFIAPIIDTYRRHPKAGIVSPKLVFYYSDSLVQYAGTGKINPMTCRGRTNGYMQPDSIAFDFESRTELAHGACMMISREVIDRIGMLDESYFMFYEEYDYCERAKDAGFEIYFNGHSHILHKQSVSVGKNSPMKSYYMTRNRIYFSRKNFHGISRLASILFTCLIAVPKNGIMELIRGNTENSRSIIRGAWWNLSH
jgi:GT2 family glycosyltransferase